MSLGERLCARCEDDVADLSSRDWCDACEADPDTHPHYSDDSVTLWLGDCLDVMGDLADNSVDSVVTDPPYGLGFMGSKWDGLPPGREWAAECLRVLKPGGYLVAFGGSRTWHRLAVAVEDAGFEIRDSIAWLYGSGFPKNLDVSKEIDKLAGAERTVLSEGAPVKRMIPGADQNATGSWIKDNGRMFVPTETAPATDAAKQWDGWGTALKPAFEPIVVGRKPLAGTVASNVLAHGTGALNIDACRVGDEPAFSARRGGVSRGGIMNDTEGERVTSGGAGRWPTNVLLDGSQAEALDQQSGTLTSGKMRPTHTNAARAVFGQNAAGGYTTMETYGDSGGASRFFPTFHYEAKAPASERPSVDGVQHPTVKPLDLMRWLVRLVTPPGGVVLEPFAGSGTTAEACVHEHMRCIAIEREAEYLPLIVARLTKPIAVGFDFGAGA